MVCVVALDDRCPVCLVMIDCGVSLVPFLFFFNGTAAPEVYTLSPPRPSPVYAGPSWGVCCPPPPPHHPGPVERPEEVPNTCLEKTDTRPSISVSLPRPVAGGAGPGMDWMVLHGSPRSSKNIPGSVIRRVQQHSVSRFGDPGPARTRGADIFECNHKE